MLVLLHPYLEPAFMHISTTLLLLIRRTRGVVCKKTAEGAVERSRRSVDELVLDMGAEVVGNHNRALDQLATLQEVAVEEDL